MENEEKRMIGSYEVTQSIHIGNMPKNERCLWNRKNVSIRAMKS